MSSIHNIPEPTTGYRPAVDEPRPAPPPEVGAVSMRRPDCAEARPNSRPIHEVDEEVGGLTWLVVLLISGVVSRLALWFFGPWQGTPEGTTAWAELGRSLTNEGPRALAGEMPVVPLIAYGLDAVGVSLWALSAVQALLGVVAIAAAYHVGRQLTGRCIAGVGAAALLALHPGVLAWTTAPSPGGLACALIVIGLYLLVRGDDKDTTNPWPAAVVLGATALTAPAAWVVGPGAALWLLAKERGRRGLVSAGILIACTLGPAFGWAAASHGSAAPRWIATAHAADTAPVHITQLTDQSLEDLGTQLRFRMAPSGALAQATEDRADSPAQRDAVADVLGETWVALNTAVLLAGAVGLGLLLLRRRFAAAACVAVPVGLYLASGLPIDEPTRVALFGPFAMLACGWLCTSVRHALTPEERERLAHEQELADQAKREARRLKHEKKHGLYAFDKPKQKRKRETDPRPTPTAAASTSAQPTVPQDASPSSASDPQPQDAPAMMRPI